MPRNSHHHHLDLPPLELECMNALWGLGEGTVQAVRERIFAVRPLAYTTVMTIMDRLARKGIVEREKKGHAHIYRPAVSEESVRRQAVERLLQEHFQGSREGLRRHLESIPAPVAQAVAQTRLDESEALSRPATKKSRPRGAASKASIDTSLL